MRGRCKVMLDLKLEADREAMREMLRDADIFIGLSQGNLVTQEMVRSMRPHFYPFPFIQLAVLVENCV